ncbi:peptidase A2, partial [Paenibacillus sepulcri]|nr:peptidase A2 [Paenibacillus sepulcri]
MDDQNKKNSFDDFFQPRRDEDNKEHNNGERENDAEPFQPQAADEPAPSSGPKSSSYYYSYGPFKANSSEQSEESMSTPDQNNVPGSSIPDSQPVEMTPPQQLRAFAPTQSARGGWQVKEKRRTSFKAIFASFMVGVVAVGALMFASDSQNWFTGA